MKVLVATHWLKKIGGSETFTFALAKELKRRGVEVSVFTFQQGLVSEKIKAEGIPIVNDNQLEFYDLILANHYTTVQHLKGRGFIIQTIHGLSPKLEQPSPDADYFVAISEEIKNALAFPSEVILNGIDCERFKPKIPVNNKIKKVLSLVHSEDLNIRIKYFFGQHNIPVITYNKFKNPVWDIEDYINHSDLVISLGRGVYESLACGRAVLILDGRPYQSEFGDGFLTPELLPEVIKYNCSGRALRRLDIGQMITDSIMEYKRINFAVDVSSYFRDYAVENLNIEKQVDKYLEIHQ